MIYQVNQWNANPVYFDESTNANAKADADALLAQTQQDVLAQESVRFSVCATFVNGNDVVWRNVEETDPEETTCKVFDTFTGQYTEVANKTDAYALNAQKQQEFLAVAGLDQVIELEEMPAPVEQPKSTGTQTL